MEYEVITYILKLLIFLPLTLGLILLVGKLSQQGISGINKSKHIKIIDKLQITKENSIIIAEIGNKKYLIGSSNNRIEILKELDDDEIEIKENELLLENKDYIKSIKSIFTERRKK